MRAFLNQIISGTIKFDTMITWPGHHLNGDTYLNVQNNILSPCCRTSLVVTKCNSMLVLINQCLHNVVSFLPSLSYQRAGRVPGH